MDWLEAKFKAIEIEAELKALKNNLHQHSSTRNHQTASENHEQNKN